ncbi:MAG: hypothetical protein LBS85_05715 [Clostridiales Family XIII bacterium]|jgi:hypothetical protein|nr:hypothetical protein [Clostridiales Family XIII bacterium]
MTARREMGTERETALSYLDEGRLLLLRLGLRAADEAEHSIVLDRALGRMGGKAHAAEIAASLQALYEAKRLVTARGSIAGKRIILGDYFMSLAVELALPLRSKQTTDLLTEQMNTIGADASNPLRGHSKKAFLEMVDRFCEEVS